MMKSWCVQCSSVCSPKQSDDFWTREIKSTFLVPPVTIFIAHTHAYLRHLRDKLSYRAHQYVILLIPLILVWLALHKKWKVVKKWITLKWCCRSLSTIWDALKRASTGSTLLWMSCESSTTGECKRIDFCRVENWPLRKINLSCVTRLAE